MHCQKHFLLSPSIGTQRHIISWHFGPSQAQRKVYIQASLHADEIPGMLVAHHLYALLKTAEEQQQLLAEIVVVPIANPIGLDQTLMQQPLGRFELASMENFNRHYPHFYDRLHTHIATLLTDDAKENQHIIRAAMKDHLQQQTPHTELDSLRNILMHLAHDADLVLDLHCDLESVAHLYTEDVCVDAIRPLARLLGAKALLLTSEGSGAALSFDEALSSIWWRLRKDYGHKLPIPQGCISTTVELRSQTCVSHEQAISDAHAIMAFLRYHQLIAGTLPELAAAQCDATPLAGVLPLHASQSGILVYRANVGDTLSAGTVVADIVDPWSQQTTAVKTSIDGLFYARERIRWARTGMEIGRVAGQNIIRSGNLLSP